MEANGASRKWSVGLLESQWGLVESQWGSGGKPAGLGNRFRQRAKPFNPDACRIRGQIKSKKKNGSQWGGEGGMVAGGAAKRAAKRTKRKPVGWQWRYGCRWGGGMASTDRGRAYGIGLWLVGPWSGKIWWWLMGPSSYGIRVGSVRPRSGKVGRRPVGLQWQAVGLQ